MTPDRDEIVKRREELMRLLSENDRQRAHITVDLRALQRLCPHPNARGYSAMGETGRVCDDCGWQT